MHTVTIQLQGEAHEALVQTWKLVRARIVKYSSAPLDATGTDVAIDKLVLVCERVEMQ